MTAAQTTQRAAVTPLDRLARALERAAEAAARVGWAMPEPAVDPAGKAKAAAGDTQPAQGAPQ